MEISFTLPVRARTKKNSAKIATFGKKCDRCGRQEFSKIVPSDQFAEFEKTVLFYARELRASIEATGRVKLPITERVSIRALFYREADAGDWNGFTDALADVLRSPMYRLPCPVPGCVTPKERKQSTVNVLLSQIQARDKVQCGRCCAEFAASPLGAQQSRDGLGILVDDVQVNDWDGTRLRVDPRNPRIEITITTISDGGLFDGH